MLQSIDFKQLETILSNKLGYPVSLTVTQSKDPNRLRIESQELKDKAGIQSSIYETLKVSNFGGSLTEDKKEYWLPLIFAFQYVDGGSNCGKICTAWWNFDKAEWIVR